MYSQITSAKHAINQINEVYPILEEIFNGHPSMTRKEIMKTYSLKESIDNPLYPYALPERVLPCFETLRHLGLLVVVKSEVKYDYVVEDNDTHISMVEYENLPKVFQDKCKKHNFLRYHYELIPKEIAIEKIIETVRNNFDLLMKLAD